MGFSLQCLLCKVTAWQTVKELLWHKLQEELSCRSQQLVEAAGLLQRVQALPQPWGPEEPGVETHLSLIGEGGQGPWLREASLMVVSDAQTSCDHCSRNLQRSCPTAGGGLSGSCGGAAGRGPAGATAAIHPRAGAEKRSDVCRNSWETSLASEEGLPPVRVDSMHRDKAGISSRQGAREGEVRAPGTLSLSTSIRVRTTGRERDAATLGAPTHVTR